MATKDTNKDQDNQQGSQQPVSQNTLSGGMIKDMLDVFKSDQSYCHARNITTVLKDGQVGGRSSEPSNILSALVPYTVIGCIYLADDQWLIFSTNNTYSEIGIFIDTNDSYSTLLNDTATIAAGLPGLNFNTSNLITGASRRGYDCGFDVYWSDGQRNPDRMLDTSFFQPNPWIQDCTTSMGCTTCTNTDKIDIQQLRLAPLITIPCLQLAKHTGSGQLPNGSYQVVIAYSINGIKCTDYITASNVYSVFNHLNNGGSINLTISGIDEQTSIRFTEMEVVVISMTNSQVQAKRLGIYSTNQQQIVIDNIDLSAPNIPIADIPISTPAFVSSDAIYSISNYLTRVGPTERPDFNYQPLANQIKTYWAAVQYPEDYYQKGGDNYSMNVGYLRGEVYAFYIRFIYSTGDKSASYPIPGLPASQSAQLLPIGNWPVTNDTGVVVAAGTMDGWESQEIYPDDKPEVWDSLCGQPIRHHKFPDQTSFGGTLLSHFNPGLNGTAPTGKSTISVLGVFFDNIQAPVDNNGNFIPDITGYEILRATRDGNESILACGQVNNMRTYTDASGQQGLFQNYPYNDLSPDYFLTSSVDNINKGTTGNGANNPLTGYRNDILSFHSPDTVFSHPYLGAGELNLVMAMGGVSKGKFTQPYKHPMFKVLTNFASAIGDIIAVLNDIGTFTKVASGWNVSTGATESIPLSFPLGANPNYPGDSLGAFTAIASPLSDISYAASLVVNAAMAVAMLPIQTAVVQEQMLNAIKGVIPARQFALQYNSFGYYNTPIQLSSRGTFPIQDYEYIKGQMQSFAGLTINNLYRNDYVALQLAGGIVPRTGDSSRYNVGPVNTPTLNVWETSHNGITNTIDSYYASYRVPQPSQYGQIDSTKQVPIACVQQVTTGQDVIFPRSPILFGGDTYINRYTEKNPFFFFNDWLLGQPEDYIYDYRNYINVPYPMFWIDNDVINYNLLSFASQNRRLDGPNVEGGVSFTNLFKKSSGKKLFYVDQGYFYLFNNGIRDFFVESSVNVGYRDWNDPIAERFYDPYGSSNDFVDQYFRSDIIKSNIFYKYDYSLSANRFINKYLSWSQCLRRDYDPTLAYTCFAYYPRRVIYSLPQEEELMKDNWRIFLPNNYKDFPDNVSVIKDIGKSGAIFLLENSSPMQFSGTESIASRSGTNYTVGDGLLFDQTLQSVTNVDDSYEYGSCQSKYAVVNTPHGIFWVSQSNGKLFLYAPGKQFYHRGESMIDVGEEAGMKYHLLQYLPSVLLKQFPNFTETDNPVSGIGVMLTYDSLLEILYICKRDYQVKDSMKRVVQYDPSFGFYIYNIGDGLTRIPICTGDPFYFDDVSWTLSYDCAGGKFISFHDWHPSWIIPSKNHFLTLQGGCSPSGQIYRHNSTTQSYCNFYGTDYPCEIEIYVNNQVTEATLQSIEYYMESYRFTNNDRDKFLNYANGFDQLMIYNKEQNSTMQNMLLKPLNDPYGALNYPQFISGIRTILYNFVENRFRVNNFYDFTKDRGQSDLSAVPMFNTDANGYTFTTNTNYFDLNKSPFQLKRFRYRGTKVFLRKTLLQNNSLTIFFISTKNQFSPR